MATSTIKPKTGTTAQWVASGRVLEVNQWGVEVTENGHHILRIGDGESLFHELPAVFDAENYEELMAQAVDATNAANTATANADTARANADAAAAAALTAANTASIAAQANTNAVIETVSGEVVTMNDSSDLALTGLKLYGKTTQVTTNGYQLFNADLLETKTAGGGTVANNGDGSLTVSGSGTLTETFALSVDLTHEESVALLKEGAINFSVGKTLPQVMVYLVRDSETLVLNNTTTVAEITQEMLTDTSFFLRLSVYGASGGTITTGTVKPMLWQDGDGTWEPYTGGAPSPSPDYPQELVSVGDGGAISTTVTGKNLYGFEEITFVRRKVVYLNNPLPAGTYAISAVCTSNDTDAETCIATFLNADNSKRKTATFSRNIRDVEIVTTDFEIAEIWFMASSGYEGSLDDTATWSKVQIERGTTATAYEPYTAQTLTAQTPNGLPGIPVTSGGNYTDANGQQWVCDEVDGARGVYVQRIKRVSVADIERISVAANSSGVWYAELRKPADCQNAATMNVGLSNIYQLIDSSAAVREPRNAIKFYTTQMTIFDTRFMDVSIDADTVKAILEDNEFIALLPLATPIETPLSAEEIAAFKALHSNKPNTTVYNDSGAHMAVEYIADTKTYIDNKFAELQNAILSAGANI